MKCLSCFSCHQSHQLARREDGIYFKRVFVVDCYGPHWGKWVKIGKPIEVYRDRASWENLNGNSLRAYYLSALFDNNGHRCVVDIPRRKNGRHDGSGYRLPNY